MATYNPLLIKRQKLAEQQAELERQLAIERAQARAEALLHIRQLIATFAITAGEIAPPAPRKSARRGKAARAGRRSGTSGKATPRSGPKRSPPARRQPGH